MSHTRPSLVFVTLFAVLTALPLAALQKVPKRPKLAAGADTNHAGTYYSHGLKVLESQPDEAAAAFYWAARLEPGWAQPYYARRIALLMSNPRFMVQYMTSRNRRFYQSKEVLSIDSLELRALMLNPYVLRDLDRTYIMAFLTAWWEQELQRQGYRPGDISRQAIRFEIERDLQTESSAGTRAWLAASERRFAEALEYYRKAIERSKDGAVRLHARRGHVFYLIGNDDSARVEMESALAGLRKEESSEFVYLYDSKAVLEHSIGMIHERRGNLAAAREAYGRALQEDLSYYPAHARLGLLALEARDTTTALSEFALAIELRGNEPSLRYVYGQVLAAVSKFDEANEQLRKTVELEPLYAAPYYLLGRLAEAAKQSGEASTQYQAFVVRAHSRDANLPDARARLSALTDLAGNP